MIVSGAGIIGDIATPAERGGFFGLFGLGALVSAQCGFCFEKPQTGLSVRLVRVLGPLLGELWLRDLAGGTIDPYHSRKHLTVLF
jgi:hypothetical protein